MILFRLQLAGIQVNLVNLRLNLQIYNVFQVATTFWRQKLSPRVSPSAKTTRRGLPLLYPVLPR
jgi:hypothetical protein